MQCFKITRGIYVMEVSPAKIPESTIISPVEAEYLRLKAVVDDESQEFVCTTPIFFKAKKSCETAINKEDYMKICELYLEKKPERIVAVFENPDELFPKKSELDRKIFSLFTERFSLKYV